MGDNYLVGVIIEESTYFNLRELCIACQVHADRVVEMVEYGILEPVGSTPLEWKFMMRDLQRLRKALRLQQDIQINLSGIALALELLEETEQLRNQLIHLQQLVQLE